MLSEPRHCEPGPSPVIANLFLCHCEKRSDEAISVRSLGINSTISEVMSRLPRRPEGFQDFSQ